MAREVAAALGKPLKSPSVSAFPGTGSPIRVELGAGPDAPQFFGAFMQGVKVAPSPDWLKKRLESIGQRSINNLVDVSNLLMFECGFPVHIYDADKLEGGVIRVERSRAGSRLPLLDGGEVELTGEELVIVDGVKTVGLAGVMGGGNSEVSEGTKRVFLECAEFDPTLVRRAAFRFGRRSEASLRFEKGIDPKGLREAMGRLIDFVMKIAGGELVGTSFAMDASRSRMEPLMIRTTSEFINTFLGTELPPERIESILATLDCRVEPEGKEWRVTPPSYRLDLRIREDLAEEVARSIGYDSIPSTIPALSGLPGVRLGNPKQHRLEVLDAAKDSLAAMGLSEVLTYSFQNEAWLQKFGFRSSVPILNPLSEDQGFMVPSLLPGMMKAYQENERHHFGSEPLAVRLFEIRPVFSFSGAKIEAKGEGETGVVERLKLALLLSGPRLSEGLSRDLGEVDFFDLKAVLEGLFESLRTKGIRMRAADAGLLGERLNLFHPGQTLQFAAGKEAIGFAGRIHPKLEAELKLRNPVYWAEIDFEPVMGLTPVKEASFKAWSAFPTMERDFALLVDRTVPAEGLLQSALKHGKPIAKVAKIFDTYEGAQLPEGKISIGVRLTFSDDAKSLEEKQVDQSCELIVKKWGDEFNAVLR
jgi:phenylalanyl-tRNA synthetase beta chain